MMSVTAMSAVVGEEKTSVGPKPSEVVIALAGPKLGLRNHSQMVPAVAWDISQVRRNRLRTVRLN